MQNNIFLNRSQAVVTFRCCDWIYFVLYRPACKQSEKTDMSSSPRTLRKVTVTTSRKTNRSMNSINKHFWILEIHRNSAICKFLSSETRKIKLNFDSHSTQTLGCLCILLDKSCLKCSEGRVRFPFLGLALPVIVIKLRMVVGLGSRMSCEAKCTDGGN